MNRRWSLTPESPDSLSPAGELIADEPFWRSLLGAAGERNAWRTRRSDPSSGPQRPIEGGDYRVDLPFSTDSLPRLARR
jgi:hypothetical protein